MNWLHDMNNALKHIEKHLLEDITLDEIAKTANASSSHFARMFSFATNMSVFEYIRLRRLTLAAADLKSNDDKIIELAYKYGYETPEAFSKAFKRLHGISPSKVKEYRGGLQAIPPLSFSVVVKGEEPMEYKIIEKKSFDVVGVKRRISKENGANYTTIPKFWDEVMVDGSFDKIQKNAGSLGTMGIITNFNEETNNFDYYIASEGNTIKGLDVEVLNIPDGKYAVFSAVGQLPESIQTVWKKIYSEFFPATQYEHAGTAELEVYLPGDPSKENYRSEVWIPVK